MDYFTFKSKLSEHTHMRKCNKKRGSRWPGGGATPLPRKLTVTGSVCAPVGQRLQQRVESQCGGGFHQGVFVFVSRERRCVTTNSNLKR